MRAVSDGAYPGVVLDRTVVQMPGYIADIYRAWSATEHSYDYSLWFRGDLDKLDHTDSSTLQPMADQTVKGYKYIHTLPAQLTANNWTGNWTREAMEPNKDSEKIDEQLGGPANHVRATLLGVPNTEVFIGQGVGVGERQRAVFRRKGKEATFISVIDPYKALDVVRSVEPLKVKGPVRAEGLKVVRHDGGTDLIVVRYDPQSDGEPAAPSSFSGGKTDALVTIVRYDKTNNIIKSIKTGGSN
ncbi:MAG: hypothetical protein D3920_09735 [Candidatus Electrothrix sp. AW2]|nr:hypothetical protein [Candidatus Electrothrix gigas]